MPYLRWFFLPALLLTSCSALKDSPAPVATTQPASAVTWVSPVTPSARPSRAGASLLPSVTPLPEKTAAPSPPTFATPPLCSPLQDIPLAELPGAISNPYDPPPPGSDDPHEGVDLADRLADSQIAIAGRPVNAVLSGRVAVITRDRFPYGNAIIVETLLSELPPGWAEQLQLPDLVPTLEPRSALTCPPATSEPAWDLSRRSLYLVYAHLQEAPVLRPEELVHCGQALGAVGGTGNALNPHLHLEVRVGPAGARFNSLAHYDSSATLEEMHNYCVWRVSNLFQLLDPMRLLMLTP